MSLHPDCAAALREAQRWNRLDPVTVTAVRAREERRRRTLGGGVVAMAEVRDMTVPGPAGGVPIRVYRPTAEPPAGVLAWLHGGAFVAGSPALSDDQARALARASGCALVSIGYRLAPEHRFPAALDDGLAVVAWLTEHLGAVARDAAPIAIGGDSAGGTLAAAIAQLLHERGGSPVAAQLLVYPLLAFDAETPSRNAYGGRYDLGRPDEPHWFREYLGDPAEGADPRVSPLLAASVAGLPPTVLVTAEPTPCATRERTTRDGWCARACRSCSGASRGWCTASWLTRDGSCVPPRRSRGAAARWRRCSESTRRTRWRSCGPAWRE